MQPFHSEEGVAVPLNRDDVDTDQIIPAVFLKRIEKSGFGQFLFHSMRFLPTGEPNPEFVLNQPEYQGASFLVTGRNFGCGSSREHAPWALLDYGFRAIIGISFAEIFHKNCFDNGIVPVILTEAQLQIVLNKAFEIPGHRITVDLDKCLLTDTMGLSIPFKVHQDSATHEFRRYCLLQGLDDIALTLEHEDDISEYEKRTGV